MTRNPLDASADERARRVLAGLARLGAVLRSEAWRKADRRGLTPTQGQILSLLARRPEIGARLAKLARELGVSQPTASEAVRTLSGKGLVRTARGRNDARTLSIALTARGRREAAAAFAWPEVVLSAVLALEPDERDVLLRGLVKLIRTLQDRGEIALQRMCVGCRFFQPFVHSDRNRPHHCRSAAAAFGDGQLRLDCAEHEAADSDEAYRRWAGGRASVRVGGPLRVGRRGRRPRLRPSRDRSARA